MKSSAEKLKKLLQIPDLEKITKYNANQCYAHMGSVAVGSICSICDSDAMNRYDAFAKKIRLNRFDVKNFKEACTRYIGESLPVLADLLKYVYQIAEMEEDFTKPKDKLSYMQAEFFDNLEIGKIENHLKCNPDISNPESVDACNGMLNAYYTQGVLLKPEHQLLPQIQKIRNWFFELDNQQSKRMLKNRVLAQIAHNIEAAEGLEQLWEKFWTVEYTPATEKYSPLVQLTALEIRSGLEDLKLAKDPKLVFPLGFVPPPPHWSTKKEAKKETIKMAAKDLAHRHTKNKVVTTKMRFRDKW